ncbi:MAG TPA: D-aminoacyl-tRNA deacylase [Chthonomonadaceae bacterium]|nr:D-aminoacyl-tRNA deacylase [Chthonomonadaceae bacterium]
MRAVVQRVLRASIRIIEEAGQREAGAIGEGLLVLLGVRQDDTEADWRALADKIANLRVFEDDQGKLNRSLLERGGSALVVSNFTLYGDCRKGRRPSFTEAASGLVAEQSYRAFGAALSEMGVPVQYGAFGAHMEVTLVNDGPVTLLLDSRRIF